MTHDYKEIWEEFVKRNGEQGFFAETIRHALQLASEYERVKKERDELSHACRFFAEQCLYSDDVIITKMAKDFIKKFESEE